LRQLVNELSDIWIGTGTGSLVILFNITVKFPSNETSELFSVQHGFQYIYPFKSAYGCTLLSPNFNNFKALYIYIYIYIL